MHSLDIVRQRYLDMTHRYLQGRLDAFTFQTHLPSQWAHEREELWRYTWRDTQTHRCAEREQHAIGESLRAEPADVRRFPRLLDRLCTLCLQARQEDPFRASVAELLAAYRDPEAASPEARFIAYPPQIAVFERPLPSGSKHHYPCTVEDIRRQLALVPEYDLEGLWAVGLSPLIAAKANSYATYYRWHRPMRKPVILLYSIKEAGGITFPMRFNPGHIEQRFRVERRYGMEMERKGNRVLCRWPAENGRRFLAEHVLLHEIGHHVQYQQRWRAGLRRWLPVQDKEQFAEDYALRVWRQRQK
jgi:hypothetical protein